MNLRIQRGTLFFLFSFLSACQSGLESDPLEIVPIPPPETFSFQLLPGLASNPRQQPLAPLEPVINDFTPEVLALNLKEGLFEDSFILQNTLHLPDFSLSGQFRGKTLFFVFPEKLGWAEIQTAHFSLTVFDKQRGGEILFFNTPQPAVHDFSKKRWYVSLFNLFNGIPFEDLLATYWNELTLQLSFKDRPNRLIKVGFHALGIFPEILLAHRSPSWMLEGPQKMVFSPSSFSSALLAGQLVAEETDVQQNSDQAVRLWLRVPQSADEDSIQVRTRLVKPQVYGHEFYYDSFLDSIVPLEVKEVRVLSSLEGKTPRTFRFDPKILDGWVSFILEPQEHLTLQWLLSPRTGFSRCTLPGPESYSTRWRENRSSLEQYRRFFERFDEMMRDHSHIMEKVLLDYCFKTNFQHSFCYDEYELHLQLPWRVSSVNVEGFFFKELVLGRSYLPESQTPFEEERGDYLEVASEKSKKVHFFFQQQNPLPLHVGGRSMPLQNLGWGTPFTSFSVCQGLFP